MSDTEIVRSDKSDSEVSSGRSRRSVLVILLGLVAVVAIFGIGLGTRGRLYGRVVHEDSGPLDGGATTRTGGVAEVGEPVTWGILNLNNTTGLPVTVEDIRLHPQPSDGFEVIDILLAGPDRKLGGGGQNGFPIPELVPYSQPPQGTVIEPDDGGHLVVAGLRLNRGGHAWFSRIDVDYKVGGKRYTGRYHDGFVLCTPPETQDCDTDLIGP